MLKPNKTKFKKYQKGNIKSKKKALLFIDEISHKTIRFISMQFYVLTAKQIDSCKQLILKKIKRGSTKLRMHIFPDIPKTKKPNEVRMGKGKGSVHSWVCKICEGTNLFDVYGKFYKKNEHFFRTTSKKLPIKLYQKNTKKLFV